MQNVFELADASDTQPGEPIRVARTHTTANPTFGKTARQACPAPYAYQHGS